MHNLAEPDNALGNTTPLLDNADSSLASATSTGPMTMTHKPVDHVQPSSSSTLPKVVSRLSLSKALPPALSPGEAKIGEDIAALLKVSLTLDSALLGRLFELWDATKSTNADEISDWSLHGQCLLWSEAGDEAPALQGLAATVYATGEVVCSIYLVGFDQALWFEQTIELSQYVDSRPW